MSSGEPTDPTQTYVLEETAITKVSSLDELAQLALRQAAGGGGGAGPGSGSKDQPLGRSDPVRRRP